jgi:hypothetical protein
MVTLITFRSPVFSVTVIKPGKENCRALSAGVTEILYKPSLPVQVAVPLPFAETVTPASGCPELSVTLPVMLLFWALVKKMAPVTSRISMDNLLFMALFLMVAVYCMMPGSHYFHKLLPGFFIWITFDAVHIRNYFRE